MMQTTAIDPSAPEVTRGGIQASAWVPLGVALASGLFFLANIDFLMRGDATTYASYVLTGQFDDLTLHIAYYAVLWLLHHGIAAPLGVPVHETLAYANVLFGALTAMVSYLLALRLIGTRGLALLTTFCFVISGRVIMNATSSEIYMLQTLLVTLAMLQYLDDRATLAGLLAGAALLVSPLSAFAFLFYPAWEFARGPAADWKKFGRLVLGGTVLYLPYLLLWWQELFYGRRGLVVVSEMRPIYVSALMTNAVKYQFKHYTSMLLLLIPLLVSLKFLWRTQRPLLVAALAVAVPHLYVISKLTDEDNTFLLNTDLLFCALLAVAAGKLWATPRLRPLAIAPFALHAAFLVASGTVFGGQSHREYAEEMRGVANRYLKGRSAVMISDWDVAISLTHFGRDSVYSIPELDPLHSQMYDLTSPKGPWPSLEGVELFLFDPWRPSPINEFFRPAEAIDALRNEYSYRRRAERDLKLSCEEIERLTHVLYRCTRVPATD